MKIQVNARNRAYQVEAAAGTRILYAGLAAGVGDYYFYADNFCAVIDLTNTGLFVWGISSGEYAACADLVLDAASTLNLQCVAAPPE